MTEQAGEPPDPWVLQHEFTSKRLNRLAAALETQVLLTTGDSVPDPVYDQIAFRKR